MPHSGHLSDNLLKIDYDLYFKYKFWYINIVVF